LLEIGKNNSGVVIGLSGIEKLLEDIPNKIMNSMGIIADVDMKSDEGLNYIAISVLPYSYPISYHGRYYYRSGSTKKALTGVALDEFLLRKQGKTWDDVPLPGVGFDDLEAESFKVFREKALTGRSLSGL
jgi:ATP-dependent DNA helicase RecG